MMLHVGVGQNALLRKVVGEAMHANRQFAEDAKLRGLQNIANGYNEDANALEEFKQQLEGKDAAHA